MDMDSNETIINQRPMTVLPSTHSELSTATFSITIEIFPYCDSLVDGSKSKQVCIDVRSHDRIGPIVALIASQENISSQFVEVVYAKESLDRGKTFEYYNIKAGCVVQFIMQPQIGPIPIFIKKLTGETLKLIISTDYSVEDLKYAIEDWDGMPIDAQRLVARGKQLEDGYTLATYDIIAGETLHLVRRLRGGGWGAAPTVDVIISSFVPSFASINVSDVQLQLEWPPGSGYWIDLVRTVIQSLVGCPREEILLSLDGRLLCDFTQPFSTVAGRRILCTFAVGDNGPQLLEFGPYREGVEALRAIINQSAWAANFAIRYIVKETTPDLDVDFLVAELYINRQRAKGMTIHEAAVAGRTNVINELKGKGVSLSAINRSGQMPIHIAAQRGHVPFICALNDNGIEVSKPNEFGVTPLHFASEGGDVRVIEALHKRGADLDALDRDGMTPLHWAVKHNRDSAARYLLEAGAKVDVGASTALHLASSYGYVAIAELLLQHVARTSRVDSMGQTPLHMAAGAGHDKMVESLLKWGADVGAKNRYGATAIHLAARNGHVLVLKELLRADGDICGKTRYGMTPLECAAIGGHVDMIRFLSEKGCRGISGSLCVQFGIKGLTEYF